MGRAGARKEQLSKCVLAKPSFYLQNQAILKNQGLKEFA